jgi:hypothetical protein
MAPGEIRNSGSAVKNQWALRLVMATFILLVASGNPARAENCVFHADYRSDVRPHQSGIPTKVTIGVLVADVTGIDDVGQSIEGDFIVQKTWRDARLASLANCRLQRSEVWFPITDVLNSNRAKRLRGEFASDQVSIKSDRTVEYHQRFVWECCELP